VKEGRKQGRKEENAFGCKAVHFSYFLSDMSGSHEKFISILVLGFRVYFPRSSINVQIYEELFQCS
jgi:hypothetical protein